MLTMLTLSLKIVSIIAKIIVLIRNWYIDFHYIEYTYIKSLAYFNVGLHS